MMMFSSGSAARPETQPRTAAPLPNMTNSSSSGDFFIRMSIDLLMATKDYRRIEPLRTAIAAALGRRRHLTLTLRRCAGSS